MEDWKDAREREREQTERGGKGRREGGRGKEQITVQETEKTEWRKKTEQDEQILKTGEWEGWVFGEGKSRRARVRDSERFNISFYVALSLKASITVNISTIYKAPSAFRSPST